MGFWTPVWDPQSGGTPNPGYPVYGVYGIRPHTPYTASGVYGIRGMGYGIPHQQVYELMRDPVGIPHQLTGVLYGMTHELMQHPNGMLHQLMGLSNSELMANAINSLLTNVRTSPR